VNEESKEYGNATYRQTTATSEYSHMTEVFISCSHRHRQLTQPKTHSTSHGMAAGNCPSAKILSCQKIVREIFSSENLHPKMYNLGLKMRYSPLIGSHTLAFDWHQKQWP